ncbi:hypothetical protein C0991_010899 [Blastosporella zonata]|nr:hypothetical protein C0991_010899 [Blastosporella zonata]
MATYQSVHMPSSEWASANKNPFKSSPPPRPSPSSRPEVSAATAELADDTSLFSAKPAMTSSQAPAPPTPSIKHTSEASDVTMAAKSENTYLPGSPATAFGKSPSKEVTASSKAEDGSLPGNLSEASDAKSADQQSTEAQRPPSKELVDDQINTLAEHADTTSMLLSTMGYIPESERATESQQQPSARERDDSTADNSAKHGLHQSLRSYCPQTHQFIGDDTSITIQSTLGHVADSSHLLQGPPADIAFGGDGVGSLPGNFSEASVAKTSEERRLEGMASHETDRELLGKSKGVGPLPGGPDESPVTMLPEERIHPESSDNSGPTAAKGLDDDAGRKNEDLRGGGLNIGASVLGAAGLDVDQSSDVTQERTAHPDVRSDAVVHQSHDAETKQEEGDTCTHQPTDSIASGRRSTSDVGVNQSEDTQKGAAPSDVWSESAVLQPHDPDSKYEEGDTHTSQLKVIGVLEGRSTSDVGTNQNEDIEQEDLAPADTQSDTVHHDPEQKERDTRASQPTETDMAPGDVSERRLASHVGAEQTSGDVGQQEASAEVPPHDPEQMEGDTRVASQSVEIGVASGAVPERRPTPGGGADQTSGYLMQGETTHDDRSDAGYYTGNLSPHDSELKPGEGDVHTSSQATEAGVASEHGPMPENEDSASGEHHKLGKLLNKVKGEAKLIVGKLGNNEKKIEEGRQTMAK